MPAMLPRRFLLPLMLLVLALLPIQAQELPPPGHRPEAPGVHALVGGRVVVRPGEILDPGTIVLRDGLIVAVGKRVKVPDDARVWDAKGLTIYAGFIEPYLVLKGKKPKKKGGEHAADGLTAGSTRFHGAPDDSGTDRGNKGPGNANARVTPQHRAVEGWVPDGDLLEELRGIGFTVALVVPGAGIIRGTSALVALEPSRPGLGDGSGGTGGRTASNSGDQCANGELDSLLGLCDRQILLLPQALPGLKAEKNVQRLKSDPITANLGRHDGSQRGPLEICEICMILAQEG